MTLPKNVIEMSARGFEQSLFRVLLRAMNTDQSRRKKIAAFFQRPLYGISNYPNERPHEKQSGNPPTYFSKHKYSQHTKIIVMYIKFSCNPTRTRIFDIF